MTTISLGAILALAGTIGSLLFMLSIVSMVNNALQGNTQAVNEQGKSMINDTLEDAKQAPIQPFVPDILGVVAKLLTLLCAAVGIPLAFKK